jgi:hypothetical protein
VCFKNWKESLTIRSKRFAWLFLSRDLTDEEKKPPCILSSLLIDVILNLILNVL